MNALKMQPFVPPPVSGRKHLSYNLLIVGVQGAGKYCLHHQFVYACFPSIRDPFFDSETPEMLWKSDSNDRFAFQVQPKRMDISRPETATHPQHLYPVTRLPVDLYRFTDANGMILVFNIDSRSSFDALKHFVEARNEDTKSKQVEPKVLCLVGNKLDKSRDRRKILCLEGEEFAAKLGCAYVECSAKDQKGLDKVKNAVIKAMETQRSQLQYEQQQRERASQGSRGSNQKTPLIRRLTGGSQTRSETPRIITSMEFSSGQMMTRNQRHRNGALISPSGRYKGGLAASSLSSENRIDEEDEETESDEKSRSSSQQSSNTSTSSKQSSITITPPCNALSSRPSCSQHPTSETSPPTSIATLSPVNEKSPAKAQPPNFAFHTSADPYPKGRENISIITAAHDSKTGSLLQYRFPSKEEGQPEITPTRTPGDSPVIPRGFSPQYMFNTQSTSHSRNQSPELVEDIQDTTCHDMIRRANSIRLPPIFFPQPMSPTVEEKKKLDEERPTFFSRAISPTEEEKRKLEEEKAKLEEAKEKLRQELEELQEHHARLELRRRGDTERCRIGEERKRIIEERKRIEEERENLREAKRIIDEEEKLWKSQELLFPDEVQVGHESIMDEPFGEIFPGMEPQVESQDDTKHEVIRRYHPEQFQQERGIETPAESQEDTKHEVTRRYHQEQFQQERQQDLQLASTASSPSSAYSAPRDYFATQKPASKPENHGHPTRRVSTTSRSNSPPRKEAKLQKRSSLRTARLAPQQPERSSSERARPAGSPPLSPDITLPFRRLLGKKEPKKLPPDEQRETMRFLRDELGIPMPQIPAVDAPPPRSPKSLLLPPGTKIEHRENVTVTKKVVAEERPKPPFPGKYI